MAPQTTTPQYPLYDTTFTLHRVSPLHTGSDLPLDNDILQQCARQFRDILTGDVLRGVRVGLGVDEEILARVGGLQSVTWMLLSDEDTWSVEDETRFTELEDTTMTLTAKKGILIGIKYEKASYSAILFKETQGEDPDESIIGVSLDNHRFQNFPLLLTKMPATLRDTFLDFLSTTFDSRPSVLPLLSTYLTTTFEQYMAYICVGEDSEQMGAVESARALTSIIGAAEISIGFDLPSGSHSLKTIDINIPRNDLPRIVLKGKKLGSRIGTSPFLEALTTYVKAHLTLDLKHEKVRIVKISCEAFVLSSDGRVKFSTPTIRDDGESPQRRATKRLVNGLIDLAKGGTLLNDNVGP